MTINAPKLRFGALIVKPAKKHSSTQSTMKITRIYPTPDGETHFDEIDYPLHDMGAIGLLSEQIPATSVIFRQTSANYDYAWHNAPQRQFVVMLDGHVEITVSDGEKRHFHGGDVFLLEDTVGRGHHTRELSGKPRRTLFIPLKT